MSVFDLSAHFRWDSACVVGSDQSCGEHHRLSSLSPSWCDVGLGATLLASTTDQEEPGELIGGGVLRRKRESERDDLMLRM